MAHSFVPLGGITRVRLQVLQHGDTPGLPIASNTTSTTDQMPEKETAEIIKQIDDIFQDLKRPGSGEHSSEVAHVQKRELPDQVL